MRLLPDLGLMLGTCSGAQYRILRELIRGDDVAFVTSAAEHWAATQIGREEDLAGGDAIPLTNGEPGVITNGTASALNGASAFTCFSIPRKALVGIVPDLDAALARPIRAENEALRLLMSYLRLLEDPAAVTNADLGRLVATHVRDLVAMAIGATRDAAEIARGRGVRAARLAAIKADIARNLEHGEMSATGIARRHRVSPRYVHKLFETEGVSLSRYVLGQRLQRVYRRLADPASAANADRRDRLRRRILGPVEFQPRVPPLFRRDALGSARRGGRRLEARPRGARLALAGAVRCAPKPSSLTAKRDLLGRANRSLRCRRALEIRA